MATLAYQGFARRQIAKAGRPRLVSPSSLASPQASSTNVVGVKRGPTKPLRSRLVNPTPLASAQATATVAQQGIRRGPTKPLRSRLIVPAPVVLAPTVAVLSQHGARWPAVRPYRSRLATPAALAASQASPTLAVQGVKRLIAKNRASRLVIPAPAFVAPVGALLSLRGARWPSVRPYRSRLITPAPLASAQATATVAGRAHVWTPRPRIAASRLVVPMAVVAVPATFVIGVKRAPTKPLRSRLITPASLATPQAVPTLSRGHTWASRPRTTASRLVVPAAVGAVASQPATFVAGVRRGPTKPLRPRPIAPAPLAAPQATPTVAGRGRIWIPRARISASRLVVPAAVVAVPVTFVTGIRRGPTKPLRSRLVNPAPLASPQASPTLAGRGHIWIPRPRITASRLVVPPAPMTVAAQPATFVAGVRRGPTRPLRSRLVTAPPAAPQAAPTYAARGKVWKPRPQAAAPSRRVVPAPAPPTVPTFVQGIRRPTPRPGRPKLTLAPLASPQSSSTNVSGVRRGPTKPLRPQFTVAPLAAPQSAAFIQAGVRRIHPKRPPSARLILAPPPPSGPVGPGSVKVFATDARPVQVVTSDPYSVPVFVTDIAP